MTAPRSPDQRARFVRAAASDLDVTPELAERLLLLSEAARAYDRTGGSIADETLRALEDCLLDDDVSRHGWWVAVTEGEPLWRRLLSSAPPPWDVGPAVLLASSLARRGAADAALATVLAAIRPGEFRRSAIEMAAELTEDAGRPESAWALVRRLGLAEPDAEWSALRCVLGCSRRRQCERSRLPGATHGRWLRHRIGRWSRRPWSAGTPGAGDSTDGIEQHWAETVQGYLDARAVLLPPGEGDLLGRWLSLRRERVTVLTSTRWEATVVGLDGRRRHVGWETPALPSIAPGDTLLGRMLPTLVPGEHLLVRSTVAPPW